MHPSKWTKKLPISEECDSKFGIGFTGIGAAGFNSVEAKDFRPSNTESRNPKNGRIALII
jgi:hypothetical protein